MAKRSDWNPEDLNQAIETLKNGGIILYPTDTIWGIGGDATREDVVDRIIALKRRPQEKGMLVLASSLVQLDENQSNEEVKKMWSEWDQWLSTRKEPTTLILTQPDLVASNLLASDGTLGVRIPRDEFCQELLKQFNKPIISTSANVSDGPAASHFGSISQEIIEGVDYVVSWRQTDNRVNKPSRVVRILDDGTLEYLR